MKPPNRIKHFFCVPALEVNAGWVFLVRRTAAGLQGAIAQMLDLARVPRFAAAGHSYGAPTWSRMAP